MRLGRLTRAWITGMVLGCVSISTVRADDNPVPDSVRQAELIAEYMQLAQPGPEHQRLAAMAGQWDIETRMWMAPGADPLVMPGQVENTMVLGGRFLMSKAHSGEGPMSIESIGLLGFDRRSGEYITVGLDTWGTYFVTARGAWDPTRKAMVMSGTDYDAALGQTQEYDFVLTPLSAEQYKLEIVFKDEAHTHGGEPFIMLESTYTKVNQ